MLNKKFRNYREVEKIIESEKRKIHSDLLINVRPYV